MSHQLVFPPQHSYFNQLNMIKGINITSRENEVISCLVNMRGTSRIADILFISPRTVETHIRNIMRKLECNSREQIIDFINLSGKMPCIRALYKSLLIEREFVTTLKLLPKFKTDILNKSLVLFCKDKDFQQMLNNHLKPHLNKLGINLTIQIHNSTDAKIPPMLSNYLNLIVVNKIELKESYKERFEKTTIDLTLYENYYLAIIDILNILIPNINSEKTYIKFRECLLKLDDSFPNHLLETPPEKVKQREIFSIKKENKIIGGLTKLLIFICVVTFFMLKANERNSNLAASLEAFKSPIQHNEDITSYVPELLTSYESFIGRENELKLICNSLKHNKIVVVSGRPGVGKSVYVTEYGKSRKHTKIVRFFDSSDKVKIAQKYRELAQELGINVDNQTDQAIMQFVNNRLSSFNKKLLFIFDNVDKYEDIKDYISNLPQNVKIIITTRNPHITTKAHIKLTEFNSQEAGNYIQGALKNRTLNENILDNLIKNVGTLPYDLKCVVAYLIENPSINVEIVSNEIGSKIKDKLFQQFASSREKEKSHAWKILQYAAHLDPDFISIDIFKELLPQNESLLSNAIKKLESLSLISLIVDTEGHTGLKIHRKLQEAIIYSTQQHPLDAIPEQEIHDDLLIKLDYLCPIVDHRVDKKWKLIDRLQQHIKKLLNTNKSTSNQVKNLKAQLYYKLGKYHSSVSINREKALEYAEIALHEKNKLYPQYHCEIADSLENIGSIYIHKSLKDIQKGIDFLHKSLKIKKRIYSPIHQSIATTLRYIGLAYLTLGDPEKELKYMKSSLEMREKLYSTDHYEIAESLNDVAWCYYELQDYKKSFEYTEKSISMFNRLYPEGNPCMIYALHTLGALLIQENNMAKSIEVLHKALEISQKYNMSNHFTTAFILYDLGKAYLEIGKYQEALKYSRDALSIRYELYKCNGQKNLMDKSFNVLGDIYRRLKNTKEALNLYEKALMIVNQFSPQNRDEIDSIQEKILNMKKGSYFGINNFIINYENYEKII